MATGFPVKANYATGDVLTAANMNDLSGTVNYLQYIPPRNGCLNSQFNVWQRGTSVSIAASAGITYTADRWCLNTGANQAMTISRQATNDTTNLPNIQYCLRYQRNSGQTGTGGLFLSQSMESVNSIPFAGKQVTFSFYARAGANYSAASNALTVLVYTGTGTDQNQLSGFTGSATPISGTATLTTTWQRFTFTGTIASTATEIASAFYFTPVGTAGAADYYEITGVQLELGSVANTYMPNQPTYQGELAACQRYYWRLNALAASNVLSTMGTAYSTSGVAMSWQNPVPMRVKASSIDYSALELADFVTASTAITSATADGNSTTNYSLSIIGVAGTPLTQYRNYAVRGTSSSGYIGFNAEL